MKIPSTLVQKKTIIIEVIVLILFFGGGYYLYTIMSEQNAVTTQATLNEQNLGPDVILFLKAKKDNLSFDSKDLSFMEKPLIRQLQNFSETISPNVKRGREDPFTPYR